MNTERLNTIIETIGVKNVQLANLAGFDAANVSRLRSGSRNVLRDSTTALRISESIYKYSVITHTTDALFNVLQIPEDSSAETAKEAILDTIFGTSDDNISKKKETKDRKRENEVFGVKLDRIMVLTDLQNVRLSQLIHVDASLISRYRAGVRSPLSNRQLTDKLVTALFQRIEKHGLIPELSDIMNIKDSELDEKLFRKWLTNPELTSKEDISSTEKLLAAFNGFSYKKLPVPPPIEEIVSKDVIYQGALPYLGRAGLQDAVIRFLGSVFYEKKEELLLYSDQNMDWMLEDLSFRMKWAALMSSCVKNGTRIKIIHNIDRDLNEMNEAIISWVPLYMSGMIESYYCSSHIGNRFSHTIFCCPKNYCISGSHVVGTEYRGRYYYHTSEESLAFYEEEFNALMKTAKPLVRILPISKDAIPECSITLTKKGLPQMTAKDSPFDNIKIAINPDIVRLYHISEPYVSIEFTHPLMHRAFTSYAERMMV